MNTHQAQAPAMIGHPVKVSLNGRPHIVIEREDGYKIRNYGRMDGLASAGNYRVTERHIKHKGYTTYTVEQFTYDQETGDEVIIETATATVEHPHNGVAGARKCLAHYLNDVRGGDHG